MLFGRASFQLEPQLRANLVSDRSALWTSSCGHGVCQKRRRFPGCLSVIGHGVERSARQKNCGLGVVDEMFILGTQPRDVALRILKRIGLLLQMLLE